MILDIFTVLFFVLGFALILWIIRERRRDVLHGPYLTKSRRRGNNVREIEGDTISRDGPAAEDEETRRRN
jgi:hypothetical protein